jgi:secondary thiamine-phosphate synthase enzyme
VINEWEDGALEDLRGRLDSLFPPGDYYAHDDLERRTQNLTEDERRNGAAHVAQMIVGGTSHVIPVAEGRPMLGEWQRLFLLELDEPKPRTIVLQFLGSSTQSLVTNNQNASPAYSP